jgi:hypothetical protein
MKRAAALLVLLASCTGARESTRHEETTAQTHETARREQQTDAETTKTVVLGPVTSSESDVWTLPPGSVIETPAGRVTLPPRGRGATLRRVAKSEAGPTVTTEAGKTSIREVDDRKKDALVAVKSAEQTKTEVSAGLGGRFWVGLVLGVLLVLAAAWKAWKWSHP